MSIDGNLVRRIGFAVVAIPLTLAVVWYGGPVLVLVLTLAAVLGSRELFDLAARKDVRPIRVFGLLSAAAIAPITYGYLTAGDFRESLLTAWPYLAAVWLIGLLTLVLATRSPADQPLEVAAITLLAVAYTGGLPVFLLAIRHNLYGERSWAGAWLVFFPLVVTWVCDTAAMFGGRALGGRKLAPSVSPGKTWSGSTAGFVAGTLMAPVFGTLILPRVGLHVPLWQLMVLAGLLSVIGQVGDLTESLFKREVGVKDSSHLIPGHGGVLDRFDSLYFVVPTAAALYRWFGVI